MTTASALASVKSRLGLTVTTFDTALADFILQAVNRLYPSSANEEAAQTIVGAPDSFGEIVVDLSSLSTPLADVRLVEASDGSTSWPVLDIYRHGTKLRVRGLPSATSSLILYGLNPFTIGSASSTVPTFLELCVFWFAMSEFYEYLLGSKSDYNLYIQQSGARSVDNMRDEAIYYEQKAEARLDEASMAYGSQ